jgi:hypothetical protein
VLLEPSYQQWGRDLKIRSYQSVQYRLRKKGEKNITIYEEDKEEKENRRIENCNPKAVFFILIRGQDIYIYIYIYISFILLSTSSENKGKQVKLSL